jgi:hypothetical protein
VAALAPLLAALPLEFSTTTVAGLFRKSDGLNT